MLQRLSHALLFVADDHVVILVADHPKKHRFSVGVATEDQRNAKDNVTVHLLESDSEFGRYTLITDRSKVHTMTFGPESILTTFPGLTTAKKIPRKVQKDIEAAWKSAQEAAP